MCPAGYTETQRPQTATCHQSKKGEHRLFSVLCSATHPKICKLSTLPFRINNCYFWKWDNLYFSKPYRKENKLISHGSTECTSLPIAEWTPQNQACSLRIFAKRIQSIFLSQCGKNRLSSSITGTHRKRQLEALWMVMSTSPAVWHFHKQHCTVNSCPKKAVLTFSKGATCTLVWAL